MLDVSDGLARDLRRLAAASAVGIDLEVVPLVEGATLDEGLGGGEDYELVFTHRDDAAVAVGFRAAGLAVPSRIGTVTDATGEVTFQGERAPDVGWRH
jgi:thiamine-monophosphate kinase